MEDGIVLSDPENIHGSLVGEAVDYLVRFVMGTPVEEVFSISYNGAALASAFGYQNALELATELLENINGIDDESIISACKLVTFDIWRRNPFRAVGTKSNVEICPDANTIKNIQTMVQRSVMFWEEYGPIVKDHFTFETDGYTKTVDSGDGDFLTKDTLWEFKVVRNKITSKNTLQLLMYWIMGQHSRKKEFKSIKNLGIFNPRQNIVYTLNIAEIPIEVISAVETDVICY